jgi:Helix-turn-helix domain
MSQALTSTTSQSISDSDYITADELVVRFKNLISKRTLANWRHNGEGPKYVKIGGRILYTLRAVQEWEEKRTRG